MINIKDSIVNINLMTGNLEGVNVTSIERRIGDIKQIFDDVDAAEKIDKNTVAYHVQSHQAVEEGKTGGLFFGTSYVMPGKVGDEYFMTKGHYHLNRDTAEYYWGIAGQGVLILMDEDGNCSAEKIEKGSLHYIPGNIAHRIANVGHEELVVGACWPSDAGHDYGTIAQDGFTKRLKDVEGVPTLV